MSVYILQWQVVLFIQGLLLIDSEMTNDVGFIAIGVSLLVLNLLLVVVIGLGARETMKRASQALEQASRRTSEVVRRASRLSFVRPPVSSAPESAHATAEIELGEIFPGQDGNPTSDTSAEIELEEIFPDRDGHRSSIAFNLSNPMNGLNDRAETRPVSVPNPAYGHVKPVDVPNPAYGHISGKKRKKKNLPHRPADVGGAGGTGACAEGPT